MNVAGKGMLFKGISKFGNVYWTIRFPQRERDGSLSWHGMLCSFNNEIDPVHKQRVNVIDGWIKFYKNTNNETVSYLFINKIENDKGDREFPEFDPNECFPPDVGYRYGSMSYESEEEEEKYVMLEGRDYFVFDYSY